MPDLERPQYLPKYAVDKITSFLPLVAQHVIDGVAQGTFQKFKFISLHPHLCLIVKIVLLKVYQTKFLSFQLNYIIESHSEILIEDDLFGSLCVTFFDKLGHFSL